MTGPAPWDRVSVALIGAVVVIAVVSFLAGFPPAVDWWLVALQTVLAAVGVVRLHSRGRTRGRAR